MAKRRQVHTQNSRPRQGVHYKKRKRRRNGFHKFLRVLLEVVLLFLLAVFLFLSYKYTRMSKEKLHKGEIKASTTISASEQYRMEGYETFPVILTDGETGRMEDIMLIASVEKENGNVRFTSVDTQTWLSVDDADVILREVYEIEGVKRLVSALNSNLSLDMKDYLILQTCIIQEMVDRYGGIVIDLDTAEQKAVNEILRISGKKEIAKDGKRKLNGEQVMAYIRNTKSEKTVMDKLSEVAWILLLTTEKRGLTKANHESDELLYHITTSFSLLDFGKLLKEVFVYEIKPHAVMPADLTDDYEALKELHEYLYPVPAEDPA